jgi:hypothetical protein
LEWRRGLQYTMVIGHIVAPLGHITQVVTPFGEFCCTQTTDIYVQYVYPDMTIRNYKASILEEIKPPKKKKNVTND